MEATTTLSKSCLACGTDVTRQKRFKASDGSYLCRTCNEKQQAARRTSVCPMCQTTVPPTAMIRAGGRYICETCAERPGVVKASADPDASPTQVKRLFTIFIVLLLIMLAYWYHEFW